MYHIYGDRRLQGSNKIICQGLTSLLKEYSIKELSIMRLCKFISINRVTFYNQFDILEDVLCYEFDNKLKECLAENKDLPLIKAIIKVASDNKDLSTPLVASGHSELFFVRTKEKEEAIFQSLSKEATDQEKDYYFEVISRATCGVLNVWVNNGYKEDEDALYEILKREINLVSAAL